MVEEAEQVNDFPEVTKFEQMDLRRPVLRGIFSYGYETPSAIQQKSIKPFLSGKDLIAQAQSGTGKTAAFSISVLQTIDETQPTLQALILSPTRELTEQIHTVISGLAAYTKTKFCLLLGGQPRREQIAQLQSGAHCAICTPGRINDLIQSGYLNMDNVKCLVLDEADELLTNAFIGQIKYTVEHLPTGAQICLFSATLPEPCIETATRFLNEPIRIQVRNEQLTLEGITQYYIYTESDKYKYSTLSDLYSSMIINQLMIYCNTKQRVIYLNDNLARDGYTCECIHSDLNTNGRLDVMKQFRRGDSRVLISTDLLARGIDVQQVSLVVNYDLPRQIENYIHRIGRSGRYGRKGIALNFVGQSDMNMLRHIEQYYQTQILEMPANLGEVFS